MQTRSRGIKPEESSSSSTSDDSLCQDYGEKDETFPDLDCSHYSYGNGSFYSDDNSDALTKQVYNTPLCSKGPPRNRRRRRCSDNEDNRGPCGGSRQFDREGLRTIYTNIPRDNLKRMFYHLSGTFIFYLLIYPVVNFLWTYYNNTDAHVLALFGYVTENPTNDEGYWKHFTHLKWLQWPPTSAESVSLLLASALKDTVALHWDGLAEDLTLRDIICMNLANRRNKRRRC